MISLLTQVCRALLFFSLLFSSPAIAKSPLSKALETAQDQQFNFEETKAVATLRSALSDLNRSSPDLESLSRLADSYLFLAFCLKNLGETEQMNQALDEAARLNPTLNPSDMLFPPSLITLFEAAKDRIWEQKRFATLLLETKPEGARIFVNGAFKGNSPLRLDRYPAGVHYIYALQEEKKAYKKIVLKEGLPQKIRLKLKK